MTHHRRHNSPKHFNKKGGFSSSFPKFPPYHFSAASLASAASEPLKGTSTSRKPPSGEPRFSKNPPRLPEKVARTPSILPDDGVGKASIPSSRGAHDPPFAAEGPLRPYFPTAPPIDIFPTSDRPSAVRGRPSLGLKNFLFPGRIWADFDYSRFPGIGKLIRSAARDRFPPSRICPMASSLHFPTVFQPCSGSLRVRKAVAVPAPSGNRGLPRGSSRWGVTVINHSSCMAVIIVIADQRTASIVHVRWGDENPAG